METHDVVFADVAQCLRLDSVGVCKSKKKS